MKLVFEEVVNLRSQYQTLDKAKDHAKEVLPPEPCMLVEKYLTGKERPSKEQVVARQHTHFSEPALLPDNTESERMLCSCKGKCATRACNCKGNQLNCTTECNCCETKCKNRLEV